MAPQEPPSEIRISVKIPSGYLTSTSDENGAYTDTFSLGSAVPVASTIGALRTQIQQLVPTHPSPERQRLLYGGRALADNEQTIGDALNVRRDPSQSEYVIHLVIKGDQANATAGGPGRSSNVGVRREAVPTPTVGIGSPMLQQPQHPNPVPQPSRPDQSQSDTPEQVQARDIQRRHQQMQAQLQHSQQQLHMAQQRQLQLQMQQMHRGVFPLPPGMPMPPDTFQQPPTGAQPFQAPLPGLPQPWYQMVQQNQQMRAGMGLRGAGGHHVVANVPQQQQQGQQDGGQNQTIAGLNSGQSPHTPSSDSNQTQATSDTTAGGAQPSAPQPPRRPMSGQNFHFEGVTPTGERVQIHHQTVNFPNALNPGILPFNGRPGGAPALPGAMPFAGLPFPPPARPNGPSALDRARQNMAEMRRMLDEMREQSESEEQRRRVQEIQQRTQSLNEYIDPFAHLNFVRPNANRPTTTLLSQPPTAPPVGSLSRQDTAQHLPNPNDVTAYLLSGPQGPHALLISPQHGTYTGTVASNARAHPPTPTVPAPPEQTGRQQQPAVAQQAIAGNLAPRIQLPAPAAAPQDALQPLLAHFWLLLRLLIFAYFLLGSNMGWQRPLILLAIGFGFWALRAGVLADGGAVRRWWEGVVGIEPAQRQGQQPQPQAGGAQGGPDAQQRRQTDDATNRARPFPTPEQVAERLMNEQQARRQEQWARWREMARPVERAVALFVASLWPGIGEATVRARREADERRRAEEEVQRRRTEEEEKAKEEAREKKESETGVENGEGSEKKSDEIESPTAPQQVAESQSASGDPSAAAVAASVV